MKPIFKFLLKYYLKFFAKLVLAIHRPAVITVAGSTGKGFVKDGIEKMLKEKGFSVRANPNSFNTEIGLPLAILDLPSGYGSWKDWRPAILGAPRAVFQRNFPRFLVLELGVSKKGDMDYLLSIVRPQIAVVTDITQRYIEKFPGADQLVGEFAFLAKKISANGLVVLNYDNMKVREIGKKVFAKTIFFGTEDGADFRVVSVERMEKGEKAKIRRNEEEKEYEINRFGRHHAMHLAATLAVGEYVKK